MQKRECPERGFVRIFFTSFIGVATFMIIFFFLYEHRSLLLPAAIVFPFIIIVFYWHKQTVFESMDDWMEVEAEVIKAEVIQCDCRFSPYRAIQKKEDMYKPHITLRYIYKGEKIISDQYARSYDGADCNFDTTMAEAQKIANHLLKQRTIKAYFNAKTRECIVTLEKADR